MTSEPPASQGPELVTSARDLEMTAPRRMLHGRITVPATNHDAVIARPRLWERFDGASAPGTWLVVAPAGFGKTTAVAQLVHDHRGPVAWLSLHPLDDHLGRFCESVSAAFEEAFGVDLRASAPCTTPEDFAWRVTDRLRDMPERVTLVLDDFHVLSDAAVLSAVSLLISYPPPTLTLIVATRSLAGLPVARWRLLENVAELGIEELRFTPEETRELAARSPRPRLSDEVISAIQRRTEGWVAAVKIALLPLRSGGDEDEATRLDRLPRAENDVIDYLADEILVGLAPEQLAILERASLFDPVCDELCAAVMPDVSPRPLLRDLARQGLLISPADGTGNWYRLHPLFAEALRRRLVADVPSAEIHALHREASAWFERQGDGESAVDQAVRARDWERVRRMISWLLPSLTWTDRIHRINAWVRAMPEEALEHDPTFSIWRARVLIAEGLIDLAERDIARAERIAEAQRDEAALAAVYNLQARVAFLRGHGAECTSLARKAEQLLPAGDALEHQTTRMNLALGASMSGRASDAEPILVELVTSPATAPAARTRAEIQLSWVEMMRGRLDEARERLERVLAVQGDKPIDDVRRGFVWLADIAFEKGREQEAARLLRRADGLASELGSHLLIADTSRRKARLLLQRGRAEEALALLERESPAGVKSDTSPISSRVQSLLVQCWTQLGRDDLVQRWVSDLHINEVEQLRFENQDQYLAYARWLLSRRRASPAHAIAQRLIDLAMSQGRSGHLIPFLVVRAQCEQGLRRHDDALASARQALELAERGGYLRSIGGAGPEFLEIAREAATNTHLAAYLAEVERAWAVMAAHDTPSGGETGVAPLTDRELQVLRLVAIGLSNQEISDQLEIAVGTVKRHMSSVFDKLEVSNRTEAVFNARRHGLF